MIDALLASGLVPDPVVRHGIRRLLRQRLRQEEAAERVTSRPERVQRWADEMRRGPIALHAEDAKAQHYEELWAWEDGREWTVSHYRLQPRSQPILHG